MGCIYGLKQYDFGGEITLIQSQEDSGLPFKHEKLHKSLLNLNDKNKTEEEVEK